MFTGLKPYPGCAGSGDEGRAVLPAHWHCVRIKRMLAEVDVRGPHGDRELLSLTRARGLIRQRDASSKVPSALDQSNCKAYKPGQIVMNRMQAWSGMFGLGFEPGLVSPDYAVCEIKNGALGAYVLALLKSPDMVSKFRRESKGIGSGFNRLYTDQLGAISVTMPPMGEQAAIVKYLAHANARIDRTIVAKRKLIALLEEQKQAIINQAVTRGLDPSVDLANSGPPWLEQIPAHWSRMRLGMVLLDGLRNGISPSVEEDGDLESFSISAIRDGVPDVRAADIKYVSKRSVPKPADYTVRTGDILLVRNNGNIHLVGRAGLATSNMPDRIYPDLLMRMRCNALAIPAFVTTVLNSPSIRRQIELAARTAVGTYKLNNQSVRQLEFALPPTSEQAEILLKIDSANSHIVDSINLARTEIDLLREFRTRLTSDVVTGQLDVRAAAALLPDLNRAELTGVVGPDEDDLDEESSEYTDKVDA